MIEVNGLSFGYSHEKEVLRDISFAIAPGNLCFVAGASGSGKSTLIRILAGLLPQEKGCITQCDSLRGIVTIDKLAPAAFRRTSRLGLVFQDYRLLPFLNVEENVAWPLRQLPDSRPEVIAARVQRVVESVGLRDKICEYPHALSGGMKARVAVARALVTDPKLLLVDEAFSALDVGWRATMYALVSDLRRTLGITAIVISHDLAEVAELGDRVLVLSGSGRLSADIVLPEAQAQTRFDSIRTIRNAVLLGHPAGGPLYR